MSAQAFRVEEGFHRIKALLCEQGTLAALPQLEEAYHRDPSDPERQSYYGLAIGLERGQLTQALALCKEAAAKAPQHPEVLINLARVHMRAGNRRDAVSVLEQGLRRSPNEAQLLALRRRLGVRRRPVLTFLGRGNPVNVILGWVRAKVRRPG